MIANFFLISHIVQLSEISLAFKGRAGVGMGDFGVLVVSVRSHPPSNSPLEGGGVRSVRALACGLNLVANHELFSLDRQANFLRVKQNIAHCDLREPGFRLTSIPR